jgi:hypothetical protein
MAKREHTVRVLQGGGALGAYQAGVHKGVAETGFNRFSAATAATFGVPGLLRSASTARIPCARWHSGERLVSTTPRRSRRRCKNVDLDLFNRKGLRLPPVASSHVDRRRGYRAIGLYASFTPLPGYYAPLLPVAVYRWRYRFDE